MNAKPKVLIFDDDAGWAEQIALSLQDGFDTTSMTKSSNWDAHIRSTYWDAIVVDVQILGSATSGLEMAENSILEYEITAPVIVVSVLPNLDEIERRHGNVFFGYVRKTNYNEELPPLVDRACKPLGRATYLHGMLTEFAKRFGVLRDTFPDNMVDYGLAHLAGANCETIKDLIGMVSGGTKHELSKMAMAIMQVIRWAKEKRGC